jgi:hypothetical protein
MKLCHYLERLKWNEFVILSLNQERAIRPHFKVELSAPICAKIEGS